MLWRTLPDAARIAGLVVAVPRFSNTALASVLLLIGSGTGASLLHMPTVASLWQTSYGQALLVKIALLLAAMALASVNLLRTKPGLGNPETGAGAARLLRGLVAGETLLVTAAVFAAAVLSSLAPPSKALASVGGAAAHVGPGPVAQNGEAQRLHLQVPRESQQGCRAELVRRHDLAKRQARHGRRRRHHVRDARHGDGQPGIPSVGDEPGLYTHAAPALVMVGHWGLSFNVAPRGHAPFDVLLVDKANG